MIRLKYACLALLPLALIACGPSAEETKPAASADAEASASAKAAADKPASAGAAPASAEATAGEAAAAPPARTAAPMLDGNQWTSWRGADQNGASRAKGIPASWTSPEDGVLWSAPIGGRSTPIVMDGRVYVQRLTGDRIDWREEIVCADAHTGEILWRYSFDIFHTDVPSDRIGWSSPVGDPETGNVYVHGAQGMFYCFSREGKVLWEKSLTEDYGRISGYGGRTHTPIVDRDLVIISSLSSGLGDHARGLHRYFAMDKRSGEIVWISGPGGAPLDTTFSVPVVAQINGVRMLIGGNGDGGVHAMEIATGRPIWKFMMSKRGINSSVIVDGTKVYACHSEDNIDNTQFGRIVCIDATGKGDVTKTHEVWRREGFAAGYASPVLADSRIYFVDNSANMICLDAESGKELWEMEAGKTGWGSPVWAEGRLYFPEVSGKFSILEPDDQGAKVLSTVEFKDPSLGVVDMRGCPAIAYGRLYVMTRTTLYCVGKKDASLEPIPVPGVPDDGPADAKIAETIAVPAEKRIRKNESVTIAALAFDSHARKIGEAKDVTWEAAGLKGKLEGATFTPDPAINGQFGLIKATVKTDDGALTTSARIRVLPELPITEDFESLPVGGNPGYWVGASKIKFQTVEEEGGKVWKKPQDDRFLRNYVYFGTYDLKNYTVQADVKGSEKLRRLPDIGIINSRYTLELRGNDELLRLVTWVPMPRVQKDAPFTMDPDVWYTLKCRVDYEGNKAIVRGKAWERGKPEPEAWMIEMEDTNPHLSGSPGLTVFSLADVYVDNVKVEAN